MPTTTHLGHGQISLADNNIITWTEWSESLKGGGKLLAMIGLNGVSSGREAVTINWTNGIPAAGEQFDYRALVRSKTIVKCTVHETGGKAINYMGILDTFDRSDSVEGDPTSKLQFIGYPLED